MTKETDATATVDGTPPVAEFDAPQATSEAAEETSVKQQEEEHPTDAEDTPDATPPVADPSREPDAPEAVRAEEASVKQQEDYLALFREAIISNYLFSGYSFDELRALATEFSFLELEVRETLLRRPTCLLPHPGGIARVAWLATTARSSVLSPPQPTAARTPVAADGRALIS
jgi:hypothetical protein